MKIAHRLFGLSAFLLLSCSTTAPPVSQDGETLKTQAAKIDVSPAAIVSGNTAFGIELYKNLIDGDDNLFMSPASLSTAFGLAYAGARGQTREQMAAVMRFGPEGEPFHAAMGDWLSKLQIDNPGEVLAINNAIFFDQRLIFEEPYVATTQKYYGAQGQLVDFKNNPEGAKQKINQWVEDKTRGKIKDLIPKPSVRTSNILVNTIYMNADWASPFSENSTRDFDFQSPGGVITRAMMTDKRRLRYMSGPGFKAVEIPYINNGLSMQIFLPSSDNGLAKFESKLSAADFAKWSTELALSEVERIDIRLPKFTAKDKYKLKEPLMNMGMQIPFSDFADFTGIVDHNRNGIDPITIAEVRHQTYIKVDESGTEAAAATAIDMVITTSAPRKPPKWVKFYADHPFFYVIRHNETGGILFMGRITNPSE